MRGVADVRDRDDTGTGDRDVSRKLVGVANRSLGRTSVGWREYEHVRTVRVCNVQVAVLVGRDALRLRQPRDLADHLLVLTGQRIDVDDPIGRVGYKDQGRADGTWIDVARRRDRLVRDSRDGRGSRLLSVRPADAICRCADWLPTLGPPGENTADELPPEQPASIASVTDAPSAARIMQNIDINRVASKEILVLGF